MGKGRFFEFRPADLGMAAVDMKATADTDYESDVLDLRGVRAIQVYALVDNTGAGSTGLAGFYVQRVDKDDVDLGAEHAICTAINTKTDTAVTVSLSEFLAGEATGATIGSTDRHLFPLGRCKLKLRVEEANDGTTCAMSGWLLASQ